MPQRRTPAASLGIGLVAVLLTIAACGGGGDDTVADPTTTAPAAVSDPEDGSDEVAAVASAGCGRAASGVGPVVEEERTLAVDDAQRRYLVTVPDEHDGETPLPVVLDFHGLGEGAEIHAQMTQWSAFAEEEGVVVVYPHGTGEPVQWNTGPEPANPDLAYVDALVEDVTGTLCVDEARVYATGLSNGAMMASLLACERADVVAAVAPVAGLTEFDGCDPDRPVPVVTFHGTEDPILLFNGGVDLSGVPFGGDGDEGGEATTTTRPPADLDGAGYPATVAAFAERNGCEAGPTDTDVSDEVVHRVYDCPDGADVEFYVIEGGGHSWPSSDFSASIVDIVGYTTYDVDGTADAWEFLRRFARS